ncbi:heme-degrading monooxygenase HmoA [Herbaspirillum seropedicae]|nr:heme-degrading monooxygenase HmoA [Herbaspirillum seropedicae]
MKPPRFLAVAAVTLTLAGLISSRPALAQTAAPRQDARSVQMRPLDANFPIGKQLNGNESPVVLVNIFTVDTKDIDAFKKAWKADADWMRKQPGFISTQLHKGAGDSSVFMNYAVWESTRHFRDAFTHPQFRDKPNLYPASAVASPHLFTLVGIE